MRWEIRGLEALLPEILEPYTQDDNVFPQKPGQVYEKQQAEEEAQSSRSPGFPSGAGFASCGF